MGADLFLAASLLLLASGFCVVLFTCGVELLDGVEPELVIAALVASLTLSAVLVKFVGLFRWNLIGVGSDDLVVSLAAYIGRQRRIFRRQEVERLRVVRSVDAPRPESLCLEVFMTGGDVRLRYLLARGLSKAAVAELNVALKRFLKESAWEFEYCCSEEVGLGED